MRAMEISRTGMDVEWQRLEVIAENIANANTVRMGNGDPYKALRLLSGPKASFQKMLNDPAQSLNGVAVFGVEPVDVPPRVVYEPGNPQADAKGYVTYPGLDQAAEMTLMVKTSRAYEANLVAMNMARQMYVKALEIGR